MESSLILVAGGILMGLGAIGSGVAPHSPGGTAHEGSHDRVRGSPMPVGGGPHAVRDVSSLVVRG